MQTKKLLTSALLLSCGSLISTQAMATMPANAILDFDAGITTCTVGADAATLPTGCLYNITETSGSYFGMDLSGNGSIENASASNERHAITANANVILGTTQPASGSHSSAPNGSESPGIDLPWSFAGNTGMHLTNKAITILTDTGAGTVTLDMEGWGVTWNAIDYIAMGGCQFGDPANNGGASPCDKAPTDGTDDYTNTGIATVNCFTDAALSIAGTCAEGDYFELNHSANVPVGDPSGFDGVYYTAYLVGTISTPPVFETSAAGVAPGSAAITAGSADGRISIQDLTDQGVSADTGYSFSGGLFDFVLTGTNPTEQIVIPLTAPVPANALYRKYINASWTTFAADANNLIASAAKVSGTCPAVASAAYDHTNGLVEGDECLQLTIEDDGPYDANGAAGTIADPGGVATQDIVFVDTRVSGTDGCSMSSTPVNARNHADWWLVAGFLTMLGLFRLRNKAQ